MKISITVIFLVLSVVFAGKLYAQEWLIAKIYETGGLEQSLPFLNDYFYDELTFAKIDRNTSLYKLKGPVKSITQARYYINNDTISGIQNKTKLFFNHNQQLILSVLGDTDKISQWVTERYYFKDSHLVKRIIKTAEYGDTSQVIYKYDKNGYLIVRTDSFRGKFSHEDEIYHYKTKYNYKNDYSGVKTSYSPITKVFRDLESVQIDLKLDERGNYKNPSVAKIIYDSLDRPTFYFIDNGCGSNSALCVEVTTKYDSAGNIIEQHVNDMTTRNALWSFSSHFKVKYNKENLIIEKEYVSNDLIGTRNNTVEPNPVIDTYEYIFDEKGNWTKIKIFSYGHIKSTIERQITYY